MGAPGERDFESVASPKGLFYKRLARPSAGLRTGGVRNAQSGVGILERHGQDDMLAK